MLFMDLLDKMGRLAKLCGIVGIALGSVALAVCGGRTGDSGEKLKEAVKSVREGNIPIL